MDNNAYYMRGSGSNPNHKKKNKKKNQFMFKKNSVQTFYI